MTTQGSGPPCATQTTPCAVTVLPVMPHDCADLNEHSRDEKHGKSNYPEVPPCKMITFDADGAPSICLMKLRPGKHKMPAPNVRPDQGPDEKQDTGQHQMTYQDSGGLD